MTSSRNLKYPQRLISGILLDRLRLLGYILENPLDNLQLSTKACGPAETPSGKQGGVSTTQKIPTDKRTLWQPCGPARSIECGQRLALFYLQSTETNQYHVSREVTNK